MDVEDDQAESRENRPRTGIWTVCAMLFAVAVGALIWSHRAPSDSISLTVIRDIEESLKTEGYVLTNDMLFRSELVVGTIPVGKILGTVYIGVKRPFERDGSGLILNYKMKKQRCYDFSVSADHGHLMQAQAIVQKLNSANSTAVVRLRTNEVKGR